MVPPDGVPYLQFTALSAMERLVHAVFTRHGGVSEPPYNTLNTSYHTGDKPGCVRTNLRIVKEAVGAQHLVFMNQVHGKQLVILRQEAPQAMLGPLRADALVTDRPHVALMVKQADCQAVILSDPVRGVVANVHCGWRGNVQDILGAVVRQMKTGFGCRETDLVAAIGPSLGPCCAQFLDQETIFPGDFHRFMVGEGYLDLWQVSRWQLLRAGLREENIHVAGVCTRCHTDMFYSYRAEGTTGRFATVVMLA